MIKCSLIFELINIQCVGEKCNATIVRSLSNEQHYYFLSPTHCIYFLYKVFSYSNSIRYNSNAGIGLKDIITSHHKLMTDVALLLRTIQKIENFEFAALNNFLSKYKEYSDQLNLKIVLSEEISSEGGRAIIERLDFIKEETNFIYEELINIAAVARDENLVQVIIRVMFCH